MSGIHQLLLGGSVQQAVDPYFYSVTSLLHGDGTNGGQNNTFLDSSTNNFTITRNGNTTQGSFSPFSQTGWGNYFDGTGDSIKISSGITNQFAPGSAFTCEGWFYLTNSSASQMLFCVGGSTVDWNATTGILFQIYLVSGTLYWQSNAGGSPNSLSGTCPSLNAWHHIAVGYNGTTTRVWIDGTSFASGTPNYSVPSYSNAMVGGEVNNANNFYGYASNVRFVKGTDVYGAGNTSITVPTTPLTAITNTQLLTCQANRFLDASSNAFAITANGNTSVQPFSPFNPTTPYSTSSIGGSGYFDGSGDYLSVPSNAAFAYGTGALTIEAFINTTTKVDFQGIIGSYDSVGWFLHTTATGVVLAGLNSGTFITGTKNVCDGAWHHVAMVRSGSTLTLYIDGVSDGAISDSTNVSSTTEVRIGGLSAGLPRPLTGYISSLRVVKGTAVYTANFTPPTAPLTAITNTSLLLNFTNGAIFDNAAVADYETVGNAQISTSVKKYGTGSMSFDGTGDWLLTKATTPFDLGTGNMTFECWFYITNTIADYRMLASDATNGNNYICLRGGGTGGQIEVNVAGTSFRFNLSNTVSQNTWTHLAVVRIGSTWIAYINGLSLGTNTSSGSFNLGNGGMYVGRFGGATAYEWPGYIDDLRISKGIARYPYNFTPPTAEFPNIGGTVTLTADPYFDYTTLLLPGNGTNGAQNNTFLDSSTNNFTITGNGNTTQGTFSPFSQTGWGNYFDGTGDYLSVADNAALDLGTGDFTIEGWVYIADGIADNAGIVSKRNASAFNSGDYRVSYRTGTSKITFADDTVNERATPVVQKNSWVHFAIVRESGTISAYANGVRGDTAADTVNLGNADVQTIGVNATIFFTGYISNVRIVKGTAVYSGATYTIPTAPLTAVTNTSLLTCQSNRFIDNSTNAFAITRNGDVSVQAFSPFNPTAAWSASTNGGSGYFDGSGDYLTVANSSNYALGTDNFTIELWVYPAATFGSGLTLFSHGYVSYCPWLIYTGSSGALVGYASSTGSSWDILNGNSFGTLVTGAWNHIALCRSGSAFYLCMNGVVTSTATSSAALMSIASGLTIGATTSGIGVIGSSYITNARIIKGTALYTSSYSPPTAPLTAVSETQFLLSATNAGIYDATSKNDLETVGNAQISTTQSKFGGSSMLFDGNGDDLKIITNPPLSFSGFAGDFTIEAWVYPTATGQSNGSYVCAQTTSGSYGPIVILQSSGTYNFVIYMSSTGSSWNLASAVSCGTATANAWNHIAVTRYGTNVYCFMNGILQSTTAVSTTALMTTSANWHIGSADLVVNSYLTGYIDDFRITRGIARYTSNFTPPTAAFLTL